MKKQVFLDKEPIVFSTGGFAEVEIEKPLRLCFDTLTNVNLWPQINQGVTKEISPENVRLAVGSTFVETISNPTSGVKDWQNEWHIIEWIPYQKFVMVGIDHFAHVPIYTRLTYEFSEKNTRSIFFKRTIEVSLNENFKKEATQEEIEALYQFLGFQWEMAYYLKNYIESLKE